MSLRILLPGILRIKVSFFVSCTHNKTIQFDIDIGFYYVIYRSISAASTKKDGGSGSSDTGMNWLLYELLWRDFFR